MAVLSESLDLQAMENGLNFAAVTFCMRLARLYFIEEKQDCPISQVSCNMFGPVTSTAHS